MSARCIVHRALCTFRWFVFSGFKMNVVGKVSSFITQGVYSVATPFHPFGGAVDIIVVMQQDGTFRSTPWHVRFGKFQGVLKRAEKVVKIEVNGVAADFHMYLDKSGEAYFIRKGETNTNDVENINGDSNEDRVLDRTDSVELAEFGSSRCEDLDDDEDVLESEVSASSSEVVMVSVDGHVLTAPITSSEMNSEDVKLDTPKFHLGPAQGTDFYDGNLEFVDDGCLSDKSRGEQNDVSLVGEEIENGRKERDECAQHEYVKRLIEAFLKVIVTGVEASLCGNLLHAEMGSSAAGEAFDANRISVEEFKSSSESIIKNENLVVRIQGNYFSWDRAAPIILGMAECDTEFPVECTDVIPVEHEETLKSREENSVISSVPSGRRWTLWPIPFRSVKAPELSSCNSSNEVLFVDSESISVNQPIEQTETAQLGGKYSSHEQFLRTNVPTSDQVTSLNLKEGQNMVTFIFSTRVLGEQKVESHIYLWKWNARIVISDVDGTITKSDVLGQFMPLVGKDWTHFGTARLFSAIKENGYQLLFLSARAIVQAYLTKNFLFNLKQDGKTLPNGPVVISPDGLFPSLFREVIRRAPHEFKIACLEDIKALFPQDYNPFYAGFGNRDTDEFSYRKVGIPRGKIFIINPKGEVSMNHQFDVKSYTSLHTLVNDMFPPTSMVEQEDFNSWNFWRMPTSDINLS